ncbi:MAG: gudP3 [Sphingomonas bacterium]|nr:gudP3 [Sphingomonas bacterium]
MASQPSPAHPELAAPGDRLGGGRSWYVLILLTLVAAVSLLDRQVITILAVDIKRDLGLNDSEIGLIYGTFFAIFYALFSIPLGRLADGWIRTRQVALSLTAWCGATIACAFAGGFGSLALFRAGVAVGEAGSGPAAYSMVSDLFPKSQRATAMAVYGMSAAIGTGLSIALGGLVVDAWNNAFPGGHGWFGLVGWQAAFIAAALPGFVLALLILLVREPVRGLADGIVQPGVPHPFRNAAREMMAVIPPLSFVNLRQMGATRSDWTRNLIFLAGVFLFIVVATIASHAITPADRLKVYTEIAGIRVTSHLIQWAVVGFGSYAALSWIQAQRLRDAPAFAVMWSSPAFVAMLVIGAFNLMVNYGYTAWVAPYAVQHYNASLGEVGSKIGLVAMFSGGLGTLAGGLIGDRLRRRSRVGRLWMLAFSTVLPLPMAFVTFAQPSLDSFVLWFLLSSLILTGWLPCCMATLHDLVLPRMRGTATAIFYLGATIFGMGTGPYIVGLVSDTTGSLGGAILTIYSASVVVWIAVFVGMRYLVRDEDSLIDRARAAGEPI